MKPLPHLKRSPLSTHENFDCATPKDFESLFAREAIDLLRLSLQLTADAGKAGNCVTLAMRDCFFRSSVSKDQVNTWARRMVMRNAIRMVWGESNDILAESGTEFHLQPSGFPLEALRESVAVLSLPDLDRLAFVICVLERYSILDCALFLERAPQEVYDAIVRAARRVIPVDERRRNDTTATFAGNMYGAFRAQGSRLDGSCGAILDW